MGCSHSSTTAVDRAGDLGEQPRFLFHRGVGDGGSSGSHGGHVPARSAIGGRETPLAAAGARMARGGRGALGSDGHSAFGSPSSGLGSSAGGPRFLCAPTTAQHHGGRGLGPRSGASRGGAGAATLQARGDRFMDELAYWGSDTPRMRPTAAWSAPDLAHFMLQYRDLRPEDFDLLCKLDEGVPKRGLAPSTLVEALPRCRASECGAGECGVCLARLPPETMLARLPCKHHFHVSCISRWLMECRSSCPLCAAPVDWPDTVGADDQRSFVDEDERSAMSWPEEAAVVSAGSSTDSLRATAAAAGGGDAAGSTG
mmetsp:Transcript_37128/g.106953  ORF Transcript_37128/g.106953 Transcript_37128/m.106953 type:complete len:313 (+) Transcript_37128:159-1097(+)